MMICLNRKLWRLMAEDQLKKRLEVFGEEAEVCRGCKEILICSGPISFQICKTVDEMITSGLLKGPKRVPWQRSRVKFLPVDEQCLAAYGLIINCEGRLALKEEKSCQKC